MPLFLLRLIPFAKANWKVLGVGLLVAAVLVLLQLRSCDAARQRAAQERVNQGQAGAASAAGEAALNATREAASKAAETDSTVKDGTDAIRNAQDDEAAARAALAANCRLRQYRDSSQCAAVREAGKRERAAR